MYYILPIARQETIEFHRVNLRGYTAHPMAFSTENELEEPHPFRHKRAQTKLARGERMRTQTDSATIVAQDPVKPVLARTAR